MHISDLLYIIDISERDKQLRRGFAACCESVRVDSAEFETLVVLLNLTVKRADIKNLFNVKRAQEIILDEKHLAHCINAVRWLHTHNLKYPDSRVSGQRLVIKLEELIPGVISSAGLPMKMGWANNGADINYAKLFCSYFINFGETTCLTEQIIAGAPVWLEAFEQLGMSGDAIAILRQQLNDNFSMSTLPSEVNIYSRQVRFMYNGEYVATTPVISHALMAKLQYFIQERSVPHIILNHDHAANLGNLVGSAGGKIYVMHYPPPVSSKKENTFSHSRARRIEAGYSLFDSSALKDRFFPEALHRLLYSSTKSIRQQQQRRLYALRFLKRQLVVWFWPAIELKDDIEKNNDLVALQPDSFEEQFLRLPLKQISNLIPELIKQFNLDLQQNPSTRAYAFHPELLVPIKSQLKGLVKQLNGDDTETLNGKIGEFFYLHLSGLKIYDASALPNPYLCGIPSLSALAGFCQDYERRLSFLHSCPIFFEGVAWYIRYYSLISGMLLPSPSIPETTRAASGIRRPGLIEAKYCDLGMDLVIKVHIPEGATPPDPDALQAAFPSRFAGGYLHPPSVAEGGRWCHLCFNQDELFITLSRLSRNGCWVYPFHSDITNLEELFELLSSDNRLRPVSSGFVLLEEPKLRDSSLEKLHAYSESALGLCNCVNPIEMRFSGRNKFFNQAFWHLNSENKAILMKGLKNMR
ncbi:hypothetical protein ACEODM_25165 [Klebsiella oxytoca]|uniref:hypothetical protein n=1 Tax=Klebsiella oxytoca TaxID=571 RepID=UPI0035710931